VSQEGIEFLDGGKVLAGGFLVPMGTGKKIENLLLGVVLEASVVAASFLVPGDDADTLLCKPLFSLPGLLLFQCAKGAFP
jgi:hypothetical protein